MKYLSKNNYINKWNNCVKGDWHKTEIITLEDLLFLKAIGSAELSHLEEFFKD